MNRICIIKTGITFPEVKKEYGDFDLWTLRSMGLKADEADVIDVQNGEPLPEPPDCKGVVITGSHSMVTDHLAWSDLLLEWIPEVVRAEIPYLGICYGHQLLGEAMGGKVGNHPKGKEIGTVDIMLLPEAGNDPLFSQTPDIIAGHVTHSQSVLEPPPGAKLLAHNDFEPCHAFRIGNNAWGVQFHPEYDTDIMNAYIREQEVELKAAGRDIDRIIATVRDTPDAAQIMKTFMNII